MKIEKWIGIVLLCLTPLMNGCSDFWKAPTSTTTTTTTTTLTSGIFYVLNIQTSQIVAYYVNAGTLTKIAAYSTPTTPITLTVAPSNNFLYLSTANGIYVYTIKKDGTLTIGNSGTVLSTDLAYTMQVDSTGTWLVEAVSGVAYAYAIPLNTSTGIPPTGATEQSVALAGPSIHQLTISPDNSYVFVAIGTGGTALVPFTSGNNNPFGSVSTIATKSANGTGAALSVAVDPTNRLFYIGETAATSGTNAGGVRVFNFKTFAELSNSPYASGGNAPYFILPIASGGYVYIANRQTASGSDGLIKGFSVAYSSPTYTLTALGSTFSAGISTQALAQDSSDKFVFAVSAGGSYDLSGYVFDTTNGGYLDTVVQTTTGADPTQASAIAAIH